MAKLGEPGRSDVHYVGSRFTARLVYPELILTFVFDKDKWEADRIECEGP